MKKNATGKKNEEESSSEDKAPKRESSQDEDRKPNRTLMATRSRKRKASQGKERDNEVPTRPSSQNTRKKQSNIQSPKEPSTPIKAESLPIKTESSPIKTESSPTKSGNPQDSGPVQRRHAPILPNPSQHPRRSLAPQPAPALPSMQPRMSFPSGQQSMHMARFTAYNQQLQTSRATDIQIPRPPVPPNPTSNHAVQPRGPSAASSRRPGLLEPPGLPGLHGQPINSRMVATGQPAQPRGPSVVAPGQPVHSRGPPVVVSGHLDQPGQPRGPSMVTPGQPIQSRAPPVLVPRHPGRSGNSGQARGPLIVAPSQAAQSRDPPMIVSGHLGQPRGPPTVAHSHPMQSRSPSMAGPGQFVQPRDPSVIAPGHPGQPRGPSVVTSDQPAQPRVPLVMYSSFPGLPAVPYTAQGRPPWGTTHVFCSAAHPGYTETEANRITHVQRLMPPRADQRAQQGRLPTPPRNAQDQTPDGPDDIDMPNCDGYYILTTSGGRYFRTPLPPALIEYRRRFPGPRPMFLDVRRPSARTPEAPVNPAPRSMTQTGNRDATRPQTAEPSQDASSRLKSPSLQPELPSASPELSSSPIQIPSANSSSSWHPSHSESSSDGHYPSQTQAQSNDEPRPARRTSLRRMPSRRVVGNDHDAQVSESAGVNVTTPEPRAEESLDKEDKESESPHDGPNYGYISHTKKET